MAYHVHSSVEAALGATVIAASPMRGGDIGDVYRIRLNDGRNVVAKVDLRGKAQLAIEAYMLRYLGQNSSLPVPAVLYCNDQLLLLSLLPGTSVFSVSSQQHAAELLAELHSITAPSYGFAQDTIIAALDQPNPWTDSWLAFYRDQRLLYMGLEAVRAGRLPEAIYKRLARFSQDLDRWLVEPEKPSLIHGDCWGGNVLADGGRITGFLDPAIYFADAEIELAFTTLFGTFGDPFFRRYQEIRPLLPGFFEERRDIYNLYPLLVHVRLFGGGYVSSVDRTLKGFGY